MPPDKVPTPPTSEPPTVALVVLCVLGALGALSVTRWVVIISTSIAGAWTLIVGGAAMGSSIAYHLTADPGFSGKVTVVERDPTYATASSSLSASSIRQQFSTPLNIHLSRFGIGFLRRAKELLRSEERRVGKECRSRWSPYH